MMTNQAEDNKNSTSELKWLNPKPNYPLPTTKGLQTVMSRRISARIPRPPGTIQALSCTTSTASFIL